MLSGKPYNNMLRQSLYVKIYIPSSQVLFLFTSAVVLVPAQSGIFYIVKTTHILKEAGTAYTLNGATLIGAFHGSSTGLSVGTVLAGGFMDQTGVLTNFNPSGGFGSFSAAQITAATNAPVVVGNNIANLTGGTGGIFVTCIYEQWSTSIAFN